MSQAYTVCGKKDSMAYSTTDSHKFGHECGNVGFQTDDKDGEVQTDRVNIGIANGTDGKNQA